MRKKTILFIFISIFVSAMLPAVNSISLELTPSEKNNNKILQTTDRDNTFRVGKMKIIDGEATIEMYYTNEILIDSGSQDETYEFIVEYEMKEGTLSVNKDYWYFSVNMAGTYTNDYSTYDEIKIEDNIAKTDEDTGELSVKINGLCLWKQNQNYLVLFCKYHSGAWWSDDYTFAEDTAKEEIDIKTQNFPAPELTWTAPDGTSWKTGIGTGTKEKDFILTNTGEWIVEDIEISLTNGKDFSIMGNNKRIRSLEPGESKTISIGFCPQSVGTKTTTLKAMDMYESWYLEPAEISLSGIGVKSKIKDAYSSIFFKIFCEKLSFLSIFLKC